MTPHQATPDWMRHAACAADDINPDLFYPTQADEVSRRKAIAICNRCPARPDCLQYALDTREGFGIWGGLTAKARDRLLRSQGLPGIRQLTRTEKRTHCPAGHPFTEDNTRYTAKGYRRCRACARIGSAGYRDACATVTNISRGRR